MLRAMLRTWGMISLALLAACASSAPPVDAGFYVYDAEASAAAIVSLRPEAERSEAALQEARAVTGRLRQGFVELASDGTFLSHLTPQDAPLVAARGTWRRDGDTLRLVAKAKGAPDLPSEFRCTDDVLAVRQQAFGQDVVLVYRRTPAAPR
jgi:hypothetical protein